MIVLTEWDTIKIFFFAKHLLSVSFIEINTYVRNVKFLRAFFTINYTFCVINCEKMKDSEKLEQNLGNLGSSGIFVLF